MLAAIVLTGVAGGAVVLLHNHGGGVSDLHGSAARSDLASSSASTSEQAQLTRLTSQIQRSLSARAAVAAATQSVGGCTMAPSRGIGAMNKAIREREAIMSRLGTLSLSAVPAGQQLVADFGQVLQQSIRADQGFVGWMRDIQSSGSCPVSTSSDNAYQLGMQASRRASAAKRRFVALWNPLASQFGQPTFRASQI